MYDLFLRMVRPPLLLLHYVCVGCTLWFYLRDVAKICTQWFGGFGYVAAIPAVVVGSPLLFVLPWFDQWVHGGAFRVLALVAWAGWPLSIWFLGYLEDYPEMRESERRWEENHREP